MVNIRAVAFDCDGVILDSFKNVHLAYLAIAEHFNARCPDRIEEFRKEYLNHEKWIELLAWMGVKKEDTKKADEIFKEQYSKSKPLPFEGIRETLAELSRDYPLFLVTSSHQGDVMKLFSEYQFTDFFIGIRGSLNVGKYCGKIQNLIEIMAQRNLMPSELVLVGDRDSDYLDARKAGMNNVIMADYGWGYNIEKLQGYNLGTKVEKPSDILIAIREIELRV